MSINHTISTLSALFLALSLSVPCLAQDWPVLDARDYSHWVEFFDVMEDESVVNAIPDSLAWGWMQDNIPLLDCPDKEFEQMWYFRWWAFRKHIVETPYGYALTEFIIHRSHADKWDMISCAVGHHIYEGRWLRDPKWIEDYMRVWFTGDDGSPMKGYNKFSSWTSYALLEKYKVDLRKDFLLAQLEPLKVKYKEWEDTRVRPDGLFWQHDVKDGMEESISGGRRVQNARPTINSYMYANSIALARISEMAGDRASARQYRAKADRIRKGVLSLWNPDHAFFETVLEDGSFAQAREAIGFIPWYFGIPDKGTYDSAWAQLNDPEGFCAPAGLTTAERRHPDFRTHGFRTCEWDGAIWPFATSQTLTALANFLNDYGPQEVAGKADWWREMKKYEVSQHKKGIPYVGEYQDEITGEWVFGDAERSRWYNHSTWADLVVTGLAGIRPSEGNKLTVNPLLPQGTWDWFCLDAVPYHGHIITVLWDVDGRRYGRGAGLTVLVDGKPAGNRTDLGKLEITLR